MYSLFINDLFYKILFNLKYWLYNLYIFISFNTVNYKTETLSYKKVAG